MKFIGGDVERVAGLQRLLNPVAEDHAIAGEDENFMLVIVLMLRRMAAGARR